MRDRHLTRQRLQEAQPFPVRLERGAVEDFQHALELALGDERHGAVGAEAFAGQARAAVALLGGAQVGHAQEAAVERDPAGEVLAQPQPRPLDVSRAEAAAVDVFEHMGHLVEQEDGRGVDAQLGDDLVQDDVEDQAQVEAGAGGHVDRVQGLQVGQPPLGLGEEARVGDRLGRLVGHPL